MTDVNTVEQLYPECARHDVNLSETYVAVQASVKGNGLNYGSTVRLTFGMALWVAIVIHTIGVEVYVRMGSGPRHYTHESYALKSGYSRSE